MKKWQIPPMIKTYEALGAIADERIEMAKNTAKVWSSSGNKFYTVEYDPDKLQIMVNDNGSYWKGYLGYPAIAFLMNKGLLPYNEKIALLLKGVRWKDLNHKFKNDFDKTTSHIFSTFTSEEKIDAGEFAKQVLNEITQLGLSLLGKKKKPPVGY